VEAAVLLPCVFLVLALLLQPSCLLYTHMMMRAAAAEVSRAVLTTRNGEDLSACKGYALRRLASVPNIPLFHVGGNSDWHIEVSREDDGRSVAVAISGHARLLPLSSALALMVMEQDDIGIILRAEVDQQLRPAWLEGNYESWIEIWK
jgi:hypothetical protein